MFLKKEIYFKNLGMSFDYNIDFTCKSKLNDSIKIPSNWIETRDTFLKKAENLKKENEEEALHFYNHAILVDARCVTAYENIIELLINLHKFKKAFIFCEKSGFWHTKKLYFYYKIFENI